jgi:hypothetical protein
LAGFFAFEAHVRKCEHSDAHDQSMNGVSISHIFDMRALVDLERGFLVKYARGSRWQHFRTLEHAH